MFNSHKTKKAKDKANIYLHLAFPGLVDWQRAILLVSKSTKNPDPPTRNRGGTNGYACPDFPSHLGESSVVIRLLRSVLIRGKSCPRQLTTPIS